MEKKYRSLKLNLISIFVLISFFCFSQNNDSIIKIAKGGYGIENVVRIGDSRKIIKEKFGRSDKFRIIRRKDSPLIEGREDKFKVKTIEKIGRSKDIYYYHKLELYIYFGRGDIVKSIYFDSKKYQTSKGLMVGDTREKAYKLYGGADPCLQVLEVAEEGLRIQFDYCNRVERIEIQKTYQVLYKE